MASSSPLHFYDVAMGPILNGLRNARAFIQKGVTHIETQKLDPNDFLTASIHADMKPFIYQIQRFTDSAKALPHRINPAIEPMSLPDEEKTFPELFARIDKTIAYLEAVDRSMFENKHDAEINVKIGSFERTFTGLSLVVTYTHPNFWFHVTTAYDILRMKGVDVGKMDFLAGHERAVQAAKEKQGS